MKMKPTLGQSKALKELLQLIQKVANSKTNILIIGESGTGKELVARMIHEESAQKNKNFVPVNCGAIPENLIESEMFGHKRGSFTGAVADKPGLFEVATGGTLFLDEIGELPLNMQVKILRALQEKVIRRVGGNDDIKVDVRVIAATNRDLEAAVAKGTFREDLYYRLNVILIKTPPLREREGDVKILAEHFAKLYATKQGKPEWGFEPKVIPILESYSWPGNIRELENTLERTVTLSATGRIAVNNLPPNILATVKEPLNATHDEIKEEPAKSSSKKSAGAAAKSDSLDTGEIRLQAPNFDNGPIDLDKILGEVEKVYLLAAIKKAGGVKKKAADLLGMTFRSIRYRVKKQGIKTKSSG